MEITVIASGSTGNCYHVTDGYTELLIEAGVPIKQIQIALRFRLSRIAGTLISHSHGDHSKAVNDLIIKGIDIYTSQGTFDDLGEKESHRTHVLKNLTKTIIGTFEVMPFDVKHDTTEPFGFWIHSTKTNEILVFATDTYYIPYAFEGITHLMIECNYINETVADNIVSGRINDKRAKRVYKSHMSLGTVLDTIKGLKNSKLQKIYLMHLSGDNSDAAKMKESVQRLTGVEVIVC